MNPKISITVDAKNKVVATLTGIVSVGAKVDVELHGMPSPIPLWPAAADYTGPSIRFRVIDEDGNDIVRFPLEKKTSTKVLGGDQWTVATVDGKIVYKTDSGSASSPCVDFNTEGLRELFADSAYDETQTFGVIVDSTVDEAEYAYGKLKVNQWRSEPESDPTVLPSIEAELEEIRTDVFGKANKPTVSVLGDDPTFNEVVAKINALITELKS